MSTTTVRFKSSFTTSMEPTTSVVTSLPRWRPHVRQSTSIMQTSPSLGVNPFLPTKWNICSTMHRILTKISGLMKEMQTLQFTSVLVQIPPLFPISTSGLPPRNSLSDGGTNGSQTMALDSFSQCTLLTTSAAGQQCANSFKTLPQVGWVLKTSLFHQ